MDDMHDRRASPRLRMRHKVGVILSGGEVIYLWTYDLSQGGLQLLSEYGADVGDHLRIFMSFPAAEGDQFVQVRARVRIVHVIYDSGASAFRVGVQFEAFDADGQADYERFLNDHLYVRYGQRLK